MFFFSLGGSCNLFPADGKAWLETNRALATSGYITAVDTVLCSPGNSTVQLWRQSDGDTYRLVWQKFIVGLEAGRLRVRFGR